MSENAVYHVMVRWSKSINCVNWDDHTSMLSFYGNYCDKYIFQHERTVREDGTWNDHYQGYGHLTTKARAKQLAKDHNKYCPGIEIQPAHDYLALTKYSMKEDTRVRGPWSDKPIYMGEDLPTLLRPWQTQMRDLVLAPADDRTIIWIYDPIGNSGKSKWCKYMAYRHEMICLSYGKSDDLLNLVSKFPNRKVYAFDLTRAKPALFSNMDLYSCIESIKNGMFVNTKYETSMVLMSCPHIVVYANSLPDLGSLSADRWKIYKMTSDHQLESFNPYERV